MPMLLAFAHVVIRSWLCGKAGWVQLIELATVIIGFVAREARFSRFVARHGSQTVRSTDLGRLIDFLRLKRANLRPDRLEQRRDAEDVDYTGQVIGEHRECDFGANVFQPLHQKVGRA